VVIVRKLELQSLSKDSGAEATAIQTLREDRRRSRFAKRLDCGAFTAALVRQTSATPNSLALGIDHERLTCFYQGRHFRLTDVHGKVVEELIS
jgi:hypothetical protein